MADRRVRYRIAVVLVLAAALLLRLAYFASMREHPEFPALMRRLGVQSYWRQNNCTFANGDVSCPDA